MTQGDIITWSLVLIGLILVGFVAASVVKRRLSQPQNAPSAGFTLSDLRALHKSGQMTDAEFERAKEAIVGAARRDAERDLKERHNRPSPARSRPPQQQG